MRSDVATDGSAASAPEGGPKGGGRREIILRVVSAAVLAPLGVWAVWAGGHWLLVATAACGVLAAFEWTRMASQAETGWVRWTQYTTLGVTAAAAVLLATQGMEAVALAARGACAQSSGIAHDGTG